MESCFDWKNFLTSFFEAEVGVVLMHSFIEVQKCLWTRYMCIQENVILPVLISFIEAELGVVGNIVDTCFVH